MDNELFVKLNTKQKLLIEPSNEYVYNNIDRVVFIPLRKKNSGYTLCAFFIETKGKWYRLMDYDCFRFINSQQRLQGDFENGGVQFFLANNNEKWSCDYGGEFKQI